MISFISSTASSTPATSANLTSGRSSSVFFALFLPKLIWELFAFIICEKKKNSSAPIRMMGRSDDRMLTQPLGSCTSYGMLGCCAIRLSSEPTEVEV